MNRSAFSWNRPLTTNNTSTMEIGMNKEAEVLIGGEIYVHGQNCWFETAHYGNGRLAIKVMCEIGVIAILTVNLPEHELEEGEFFVETYSENVPVADACRDSGIFCDTGKRVKISKYAEAEVWRLA